MNVLLRDLKLTITDVTPTVVACVVFVCMVLIVIGLLVNTVVLVWIAVVVASDVVVGDTDLSALVDANRVVTGESLVVCKVVGAFVVILTVSVGAKALVAFFTVVAAVCDVVIWSPVVRASVVVAPVFVGDTKVLVDVTTVVLG